MKTTHSQQATHSYASNWWLALSLLCPAENRQGSLPNPWQIPYSWKGFEKIDVLHTSGDGLLDLARPFKYANACDENWKIELLAFVTELWDPHPLQGRRWERHPPTQDSAIPSVVTCQLLIHSLDRGAPLSARHRATVATAPVGAWTFDLSAKVRFGCCEPP